MFDCDSLFIGYAYEELSEVSPDHRYLAYTMYDKDNDYFKLSVRELNFGSLCSKPQADRVSNLAWAKNGQALLYVVTDHYKRPYRLVIHYHSKSLVFSYCGCVSLRLLLDFVLSLGYIVAHLEQTLMTHCF